jgi:hypothetical protein
LQVCEENLAAARQEYNRRLKNLEDELKKQDTLANVIKNGFRTFIKMFTFSAETTSSEMYTKIQILQGGVMFYL